MTEQDQKTTKRQAKAFSQALGNLLAGQMMLEFLGTTDEPYAERARELAVKIDTFINDDFMPTQPPEAQARAASPFRRRVTVRESERDENNKWVTRVTLECGHSMQVKGGRRFYVCQECASAS